MKKKLRPFRLEDYNDTTVPVEALDQPVWQPSEAGVNRANPTVTATQPIFLPYQPDQPARPVVKDYAVPQQPGAYPVLPPAPFKSYNGTPPGSAPPADGWRARPVRRRRRSPLPGLVSLCCVVVQLILLTQVICQLLGVQSTSVWLTLLFATAEILVWPVRQVVANANLTFLAGSPLLQPLEVLVAILAYGLLARLLALLLRALLN